MPASAQADDDKPEDAHKHEMMSYADESWRCLVFVAGCWLPVAGLTDFDFNLQWPRPKPWNAKAKAKWTNKATRQQTSFNGHIEVVVGATRLATLPVKWFMPMALPGTQQSPSPSPDSVSVSRSRCQSRSLQLPTNFLVFGAEKLTGFCRRRADCSLQHFALSAIRLGRPSLRLGLRLGWSVMNVCVCVCVFCIVCQVPRTLFNPLRAVCCV